MSDERGMGTPDKIDTVMRAYSQQGANEARKLIAGAQSRVAVGGFEGNVASACYVGFLATIAGNLLAALDTLDPLARAVATDVVTELRAKRLARNAATQQESTPAIVRPDAATVRLVNGK